MESKKYDWVRLENGVYDILLPPVVDPKITMEIITELMNDFTSRNEQNQLLLILINGSLVEQYDIASYDALSDVNGQYAYIKIAVYAQSPAYFSATHRYYATHPQPHNVEVFGERGEAMRWLTSTEIKFENTISLEGSA